MSKSNSIWKQADSFLAMTRKILVNGVTAIVLIAITFTFLGGIFASFGDSEEVSAENKVLWFKPIGVVVDSEVYGSNNISIEDIQINPFQPRTEFDEEKLFELSESIKELGIIQPITVRKLGYNKYQLISGERRLRASKILNLTTIPSYIRIANDEQMLEMALVENIQRDNLNPIDIALSFQRLIKECNLTQEECGNKLGKQRSTITNFLRLLKLPSKIQEGLKNERITVGHARALININDKENQLNIYHDIIESGFSVREVEQIAKDFLYPLSKMQVYYVQILELL